MDMMNGKVTQRWGDQDKFAYILITPAKDEEESLPTVIQSIVNQSLRPTVWFIVDDASEDRTPEIISQAVSEHPWIHFLKLDTDLAYDIGKHYASVCITGFDQALAYCEQNNLKFHYIALSDADMVYRDDYFTKCINFLHDNGQFGIVSGNILVRDKGGNIYEEDRIQLGDEQPYGTGRVWRKEAFADTGGYMVAKSPDTVSNIKALSGGWKIKRLLDVVCYQTRDTAEKPGLWSGYLNRGERAYYLRANLLNIFNTVVDMIFISRSKNFIVKSFAFLSGYLKSWLRREEQCDNEEVKKYAGSYRRIFKNYRLFINGLRKRKNS